MYACVCTHVHVDEIQVLNLSASIKWKGNGQKSFQAIFHPWNGLIKVLNNNNCHRYNHVKLPDKN